MGLTPGIGQAPCFTGQYHSVRLGQQPRRLMQQHYRFAHFVFTLEQRAAGFPRDIQRQFREGLLSQVRRLAKHLGTLPRAECSPCRLRQGRVAAGDGDVGRGGHGAAHQGFAGGGFDHWDHGPRGGYPIAVEQAFGRNGPL